MDRCTASTYSRLRSDRSTTITTLDSAVPLIEVAIRYFFRGATISANTHLSRRFCGSGPQCHEPHENQ